MWTESVINYNWSCEEGRVDEGNFNGGVDFLTESQWVRFSNNTYLT